MTITRATPEEVTIISHYLTKRDTGQSAALRTLVADPHTWYHVPLHEVHGRSIEDQMAALKREGADHGYGVETLHIPGHPKGGFFARVGAEK
jgi:hypothetical protein